MGFIQAAEAVTTFLLSWVANRFIYWLSLVVILNGGIIFDYVGMSSNFCSFKLHCQRFKVFKTIFFRFELYGT